MPTTTVERLERKTARETVENARETFESEESAREWLYSPVATIRNRRPIDLIRRGELDAVIEVLAGLHSGARIQP